MVASPLALYGRSAAAARPAYRPRQSSSLATESLLALYFALCFLEAAFAGMWYALPFLWLFLHGYGYVAWLGVSSRRAA